MLFIVGIISILMILCGSNGVYQGSKAGEVQVPVVLTFSNASERESVTAQTTVKVTVKDVPNYFS